MSEVDVGDELLRDVIERLRSRDALDDTSVADVTIGDAAVLVELTPSQDAGAEESIRPPDPAGLAYRPDGDPPDDEYRNRDPRGLLAPIEDASPASSLDRAVAVATLNAVSAPFVGWRDGDPMALLDADVERVATVGLFRPAFRKFADVEVRVIERVPVDPFETSADVDVTLFPATEAAAAMAGCAVVFVTGSTLIYGGMETYLKAAPEDAIVVVIGATASMLPDPLFDAGIDVVAGVEVTEPERVRRAVARGVCGTDLHDEGVRKGYVAPRRPSGIRINPSGRDPTDPTI